MNIILVSNRLAKARTLCVGNCQSGLFLLAGLILFTLLSVGFGYLILFKFGGVQVPVVEKMLLSARETEGERERQATQQRLSAMAVKVGEMQAQILRLEALGERVAKVSGIKKDEINFDQKPGRGGPLVPGASGPINMDDFQQELTQLARVLDDKTDQMAVMEALLSREQVRKAALPSALPVRGFYSSGYGWRRDPFTGQRTMHDGVDFVADSGTSIKAAAGGIVVYSDIHAGYGNMIEVDHGNGLVSRYAHASKRLAKEGDVVLRGQKIGEVGSTGRSTGPHLHFEVLLNGTPQNPTRYLNLPG